MLSVPPSPLLPLRAPPPPPPPPPPPDSEPSLKKQKVNEGESDYESSEDGGSSDFGELDPLPSSTELPRKGVTTYNRENVYDVVKERYTPIFPGDKVGDKACWLKYLKEINESEGFDITDFPGCGPLTTIFPLPKYEFLNGYAEQALELYNEENGTKYKFNEILKVNGYCTQYYNYYITFTVTNGEKEYFQAQVARDVDQTLECLIIRPREKGSSGI